MRRTKLTFAILLKDAFASGRKLFGRSSTALQNNAKQPIINRSGIYCYTDLPVGKYSVATDTGFYRDRTIDIETAELDTKFPAVDVSLEPDLNYPFPSGTTLLKGVVKSEGGAIVAEALVEIKDMNKEFVTNEMGRFVFYFKGLEEAEEKVTLDVSHDGFKNKKEHVNVIQGETTVIEITLKQE